jgi:hypothetical protein
MYVGELESLGLSLSLQLGLHQLTITCVALAVTLIVILQYSHLKVLLYVPRWTFLCVRPSCYANYMHVGELESLALSLSLQLGLHQSTRRSVSY